MIGKNIFILTFSNFFDHLIQFRSLLIKFEIVNVFLSCWNQFPHDDSDSDVNLDQKSGLKDDSNLI